MIAHAKNKLYKTLMLLILGGYAWLFWASRAGKQTMGLGCLFKKITSYPCPACGTTRAVMLGFKGHLLSAFWLNPFSVVVMLVIIIAPVWITYDWITGKQSFFDFYKNAEQFITKKLILVLLILLTIGNWYWNFKKHL